MLCSLSRRLGFLTLLGLFLIGPVAAVSAHAADDPAKLHAEAVRKGLDYLRNTAQNPNGSFAAAGVEPGITAIVVTGVLRSGVSPDDPMAAKALKYMEGYVQPDGGLYDPNSRQKNYETCVALVAFQEANKDKRYDKLIAAADKYLKGLQFPEGDDRAASDPSYGGVGYSGPQRPDLSNSQFLMDALQAAGNGPNDEAVKRALIFVSRCQNLENEYNNTEWAAKVNDGGFYYAPGRSQAGNTENGGLKSYGSMTYAGLKSMIFAGVKKEDPRVKAAVDWLRKHYSVTENPGAGTDGLFYYYCLFGKALGALGEEQFADAAGTKHAWRADLIGELAKRQQPNGSWVNANNKWMEGDPKLVTGYALIALSYAKPGAN